MLCITCRIGKGQKKPGKIVRKKSKVSVEEEAVEEEAIPEEHKNASNFTTETNDEFEGNNNNYQPLPEDCVSYCLFKQLNHLPKRDNLIFV